MMDAVAQQTPPPAVQPVLKVCPLATRDVVDRIILFTEHLMRIRYYTYQSLFIRRTIESVIDGEGAIITGLWARQCLAGSTVILDRDGSACQIKDHPRAWMTSPKRTVYRVCAKNGFEVRATNNHPFLTKRGWVNTEDLEQDDWLCVLEGWDKYGDGKVEADTSVFINWKRTDVLHDEYELTEDYGKLLGYLTADGYAFRAVEVGQSVKFTSICELYLEEVEELVLRLFGDEVEVKRYEKGKGFDLLLVNKDGGTYKPTRLRRFLRALRADDKFPTAMFGAPKKVIVAFLNRLYAADGCASRGIQLACGGSRVYAHYVQALLARLGIHARVKSPEWMSKSTECFYRLTIDDKLNMQCFLSEVGPIYGKEEACTALDTELIRWSNRKYEEATPGEDGEGRVWSKISSVEYDGEEAVYDIAYPGKGWFFAQGIAVHNSGKTEAVAGVCVGLAVMLPVLATTFPDDDRFKPYAKGFLVGIYAPIDEQARLPYDRIRTGVSSEHALAILADSELKIKLLSSRGDRLALSNGSIILSKTASPQASIEGHTHHFIVLEEAQKILRSKVDKEIRPMLAATNGTMAKIGTAWESRGGFHHSIQQNVDEHRDGGKRSHFEFPYDIVLAEKDRAFDKDKNPFHLNYRKFVEKEIHRLGGADNEEFKMNFRCLWMESRVIAVNSHIFKAAALDELEMGPHKSGYQVAGLDIGKVTDASILTSLVVDTENPVINTCSLPGADEDKQVYYTKTIFDWYELGGAFEGNTGQYRMLIERLEMLNIQILVVDATTIGDPVFERIEAMIGSTVRCVPFKFTSLSKSSLYKYYLQEIHARRLLYAGGSETRNSSEFRKFQAENLDLDRTEYAGYALCGAPDGGHDDYPDSAALACWAEKLMSEIIMPEIQVSSASGLGGRSLSGGRGLVSSGEVVSTGGRGSRYSRRW